MSTIPGMKAQFAEVKPAVATIARPTTLVTAGLPGIVEIPPQRMSAHSAIRLPEAELPAVRRVVDAEVEELARKGLPFLQLRYPRLDIGSFTHFVRGALWRNTLRIVRTEDAWGAAEASLTIWEPNLTVRVLWLQRLSNSIVDPMAILRDFEAWARNIRATKISMEDAPGINLSECAKVLDMTKEVVFEKELK